MDFKEYAKKSESAKPKKKSFISKVYHKSIGSRHSRRNELKGRIEQAGIRLSSAQVTKFIIAVAVIINIIISVYAIQQVSMKYGVSFQLLFVSLIFLWILVFAIIVFMVWFLFYIGVDVAIYKRTRALETVLPDFLQLASSNVRAGMTIEQALWYAVRPRFGVLSKDIEDVAKSTFTGEDFEQALETFVKKYDSKVLARSMSLLVEGVRAGGEIGELLDKISSNIQETTLMKKELAANVMTYIIFITFASVVAAPFLFGLAYELISVIQHIFAKVDMSGATSSSMSFSISEGAVDLGDFKIFALVSLAITSLFSSFIVSTIKTGSIHGSVKYFPSFFVSSVVLFFIIIKVFGAMLGGVF